MEVAAEPVLRKELGLRDLVLFNLAALISTRWISVAAHVGPGTIVLWLLAEVAITACDLAEVIGETDNEDILTRLFQNFCIGK